MVNWSQNQQLRIRQGPDFKTPIWKSRIKMRVLAEATKKEWLVFYKNKLLLHYFLLFSKTFFGFWCMKQSGGFEIQECTFNSGRDSRSSVLGRRKWWARSSGLIFGNGGETISWESKLRWHSSCEQRSLPADRPIAQWLNRTPYKP